MLIHPIHVTDLPTDPIPGLKGFGDSFHHTNYYCAMMVILKEIDCEYRIEDFTTDNVSLQFRRGPYFFSEANKKWPYNNWWVNPDNFSRDQFMSVVLFLSTARKNANLYWPIKSIKLVSYTYDAFLKNFKRLKNNFFIFPNKLLNTTNEKKKWYKGQFPDILTPTAINQFFYCFWINERKLIYKIAFRCTDIFFLFETILKLKSKKTDDCKYLVHLLLRLKQDTNLIYKLSAYLYFNFRDAGNGLNSGLKVLHYYFRPESGEDFEKMYGTFEVELAILTTKYLTEKFKL